MDQRPTSAQDELQPAGDVALDVLVQTIERSMSPEQIQYLYERLWEVLRRRAEET